MGWMLAFTVFGGLALLYVVGHRNERAVKRDWELLLTPKGDRLYRSIEGRVQANLQLADLTYDEAFSTHDLGSMDDARRLLDAGYRIIEAFAPDMLRLLASMAVFSRMVSAMAPMPPLRPRDFRLAQIASLAYLGQLLHHFLVSTAERFRLRIYVLGQSFGLAMRFLLRSTQRIVKREPEAEREWRQIQTIRQDFQTLTDESLASLHILLTSLAAERREDVFRE